jgi:hypothetical protein
MTTPWWLCVFVGQRWLLGGTVTSADFRSLISPSKTSQIAPQSFQASLRPPSLSGKGLRVTWSLPGAFLGISAPTS